MWIPPPLRKFSTGSKVDKNHVPSSAKKASDKKYKVKLNITFTHFYTTTTYVIFMDFFRFLNFQSPVNEVTKPIPNEDEQNGEEPDDELELPPPMKPISESILVNASDATSVTSQRVSTSLFIHFFTLLYVKIYVRKRFT